MRKHELEMQCSSVSFDSLTDESDILHLIIGHRHFANHLTICQMKIRILSDSWTSLSELSDCDTVSRILKMFKECDVKPLKLILYCAICLTCSLFFSDIWKICRLKHVFT